MEDLSNADEDFEIQSEMLEVMANKQRFSEDIHSPVHSPVHSHVHSPAQNPTHSSANDHFDDDTPIATSPVRQPRSDTIEVPAQSLQGDFEAKKEHLIEIRKLRSRGAFFSRQFTFEDDINEMRHALELARIEVIDKASQIRNKSGVKTARRVLLAGVSILEFLHRKWNPLHLHLDGFGEYVMSNIDDYDNVFQRLLEKYQGTSQMQPEVELIVMLGTSAVMFHISNMFVSRAMTSKDSQAEQHTTDADRFE